MANTKVSFIASTTDQFRDAIAQLGVVPPDAIIPDGAYHRFSSSGKPGGTSGWYVFNDGEIPTGSFGDARTGVKVSKWQADVDNPLTAEERQYFARQQSDLQAKRKADETQLRLEAKKRAALIMGASVPATDNHPYLLKKGVGAHGIGLWDDPTLSISYSKKTGKPFIQITSKNGDAQFGIGVDLNGKTEAEVYAAWKSILIIPLVYESGEIQSLQFISKNGDKKFLYGGKMQGCYFPIGDIKGADTILIAEGYATAATIHAVTGLPVVVAYNSGNLLPVAKAIRAQYPEAGIILCADDDIETKGNPGVTAAAEAAKTVDGKVVIPAFGNKRPKNVTDFNDMEAFLGKDAVAGFFANQLAAINGGAIGAIPDNLDKEPVAFISRPANMNTSPTAKENPVPPLILSLRNPTIETKIHFSPEESQLVGKIWKKLKHEAICHDEAGYHILIDDKRKITVTKERIEFPLKPKHRPDDAYVLACEHARQFWGGRMEIHGDSQHSVKAWAYASVHGIQVTNFTPTDQEKLEAEKIIGKLGKEEAPMFCRPSMVKSSKSSKPSV